MLLVLAVVVAAVALGSSGPATASALRTGGTLVDYRIDMVLEPNGSLRVREEVRYVLGFDEEHGFRRFIPVRVRYDDRHDRVYRITDVAVTATPDGGSVLRGDPAGVDDLLVGDSNDNTVIRIGNPGTFIDGQWRYTIDYVVSDVVDTVDVPQLGTVEELAWNVVGTAWEMPIGRLTARLTLPVPPIDVACYQGAFGSVQPCPAESSDTSVDVALDGLAPYEAVTLLADMPTGTFTDATAVLEERWTLARAFRPTPFNLAGSTIATILFAAVIGRLLAVQARDRRLALNAYLPAEADPETEGLAGFFEKPDGPVQFRPPESMTPGLCGVLVDEKADALDVSATIVDLAVRGYLRIEELPSERRGKPQFQLRFLRDVDPSLLTYEAKLLAHLQASTTGGTVRLDDLRTNFASQLDEVRNSMYDETVHRHWFRRRPDRVRGLWALIGVLALVVGGALAVMLVLFTTFGLFALPLVVPGLLIVAVARRMPSRTAEGRRMLELCVGYERFLEVADADQLQFLDRQYDYVAGLPYAMVFGITDHWARVLAVLQEQGLDVAPTWYVGRDPGAPFRYAMFGNAMAGFGSSAATAMSAPKPSSSGGGFSGGGFSGGGGGGGGGGGW